jgi:hypothetical protein
VIPQIYMQIVFVSIALISNAASRTKSDTTEREKEQTSTSTSGTNGHSEMKTAQRPIRDTTESYIEMFVYVRNNLQDAKHHGYSNLCMMSEFIEKCSNQCFWPLVKVVHGLHEGRGVVAMKDLPPNTIVCNYGGVFQSLEDADTFPKTNYCVEMPILRNGKSKTLCLNHYENTPESVGKYINHSQLHSNLNWKIIIRNDGTPDVIFTTMKKVKKGTELTWNYGTEFNGLAPCVASCQKCHKKS